MDENTTRRALMDNVSDDLMKLEDYIKDYQNKTDIDILKTILSESVQNIRTIRKRIYDASDEILSGISIILREWYNSQYNSIDLLIVCNKLKKCTFMNSVMRTASQKVNKNKIFIVHGRDNEMKLEVAHYITSELKCEAIILNEQPNGGKTVIEKFEEFIFRKKGESFAKSRND